MSVLATFMEYFSEYSFKYYVNIPINNMQIFFSCIYIFYAYGKIVCIYTTYILNLCIRDLI